MKPFPRSIAVGPARAQATYRLQPGQLLLRFGSAVDGASIDRILHRFGLSPFKARASDRPPAQPVDPQLRRVDLGSTKLEAVAVAQLLSGADGVESATPVYEINGDPSSAASPVADIVIVRFRSDVANQRATVERIEREFGFLHRQTLSSILAPFHCFRRASPGLQAYEVIEDVARLPAVDSAELDWLSAPIQI